MRKAFSLKKRRLQRSRNGQKVEKKLDITRLLKASRLIVFAPPPTNLGKGLDLIVTKEPKPRKKVRALALTR